LFKYEFFIPSNIHSDKINRITELKSGLLVTTSSDTTFNILKMDYKNKKYEVIQVLLGHTSSVWMCLELSDGNIATCSNDKTIRIWFNDTETNQYEPFKILSTDHDEVGEILETKNKILVTCSVFDACFQVQFWSVETYERIGIVEDIATCGGRDIIQLTDDILCVNGSRDEEGLQFISISQLQKVKHLKTFNDNNIDSFYKAKDGTVFIGFGYAERDTFDSPNNYGTIKQFRFDEKNIELIEICEKEKCHSFPVLGFYELSNGRFISFAKEIIVWK
jgi:WD40 repeat protein